MKQSYNFVALAFILIVLSSCTPGLVSRRTGPEPGSTGLSGAVANDPAVNIGRLGPQNINIQGGLGRATTSGEGIRFIISIMSPLLS